MGKVRGMNDNATSVGKALRVDKIRGVNENATTVGKVRSINGNAPSVGKPRGVHEHATSVGKARSMNENATIVGKARTVNENAPVSGPQLSPGSAVMLSTQRLLFIVWMSVGLAPLLLQARSFARFVTPHKISKSLISPAFEEHKTVDILEHCPVEGLMIAGIWWNVHPIYYVRVDKGHLCHFVVPQYNIHGNFFLGDKKVTASITTPKSCADESFEFQHYFYHGSLGYYSFYEEATGTYCANDKTSYVLVKGLGTYDINGKILAVDQGCNDYRNSYWYGIAGSMWIAYRSLMLRRSFVSCKRFGRRCEQMEERIRLKDAVVYVQETMRIAAYDARNYHRVAVLYLLVEGIMSDLFLLIAQEGLVGRLQYISLGYNLSGIMSMLFEMIETMHWFGERLRCSIKRLLFNYETMLFGEFICSAAMQNYLTSLNRSRGFQHSNPTAEVVSYYVWSLVGHGVIVLGCVFVLISTRSLGAIGYMRWRYKCFAVLIAPCCVDSTLGIRGKLMVLGGYCWENRKLYYKVSTLKAFGMMKMVEDDGTEFLVLHKVYWITVPRVDLFVIGSVHGKRVDPCTERLCTGIVSMFTQVLGGPAGRSESSRWVDGAFRNKIALAPSTSKIDIPRLSSLVETAASSNDSTDVQPFHA